MPPAEVGAIEGLRRLRRAIWRVRRGKVARPDSLVFVLVLAGALLGVVGGLVLTLGHLGGVTGAVVASILWLAALALCLAPPAAVRRVLAPPPPQVPQGDPAVWAARAGSLSRAEQELGARNQPNPQRRASLLPPPSDRPSVAIVVAAYNERRFVKQCLASLRAQSFTDWECIVVDDDSSDTTAGVVAEIAEEDPRIRVVAHSRNRGLAATRNTGLSQVRAPLVTFLDSDDVLLSASLEDRVNAFRQWESPDLAGTFCGLKQVPEKIYLDVLPPSYPWPKPPKFVDLASCAGVNPFGVHQPLLRTDIARALGGFDESFRVGAEDYEFWMRVMRAGYHFRPSSLLTALYRQKAGSMVRDLIVEHYDSCRQILDTLDRPQSLERHSADAPWPIEEPLGVLQRKLVLAERAVRSSGLAIGIEKPDKALALLSRIEPHVAELALRHVNIRTSLNAGVRRAWGVSELPADSPIRAQVQRLEFTIREMLVERTTPLRDGPAQVHAPRQVDLLLCPTNAAHAREMAAAARGSSAVFVSLAELTDQGAAEAAVASGVDSIRTLDLVGEPVGFRAVVISEPITYWTRAFAQAVATAGGRVLLMQGSSYLPPLEEAGLTLDGLPLVRVRPEELPAEVDGPLVSAADLDLSAVGPTAELARVLAAEESWRPYDADTLSKLKDAFAGERCVIIGNGPSLNQMDLTLFAKVPTIAVNGIFYAQEQMGFDPTFYVVEDTAVMADNTEEIRNYRAQWKLFPSIYRRDVGEADNVAYFRMNRGFYHSRSPHYSLPRFSTDAANRVYCGQSVTIINLQLAYHFGFTDVALIGMDFSYTIPDSAEREGDLLTSTEDDPNHFHPEYFGKGKKWKDPKLDRVLASYELAKRVYEADGRRILNATVGGNLEAFERVNYKDFLA